MIHSHEIDGLTVKTGDLICTSDAGDTLLLGQVWRLIGMLIPGPVDHIAVYVGPQGRCVEAGARLRVITFNVKNNTWNAEGMMRRRGPILDKLYGVTDALAGRDIAPAEEQKIRESVAKYCLKQASLRKPYNLNFLDSKTEKAFYCSQLAYRAYLRNGIDLNTGRMVPRIPGTDSIVFPQEIWNGCKHQRVRT